MFQIRLLEVLAILSLTIVLVGGPSASESIANEKRPKLTIGSKAPKIDIEHWLSIPEGFEEVKRFKKGNIYVVEFWATWCGPCRRAIPHISKLSETYAEEGVQIISVSSEELSKVKAMLLKKASKTGDKTYADYTSKYCLACDPDGSVRKSIYKAVGRSTIPSAVIVGKTGLVEWVGNPSSIDTPLEQIVAGTWDRGAHKKAYERSYRIKRNKKAYSQLIKDKKFNQAVLQIGKLAKDYEGKDLKAWQLKQVKIGLDNELRRSEKDFKKIAAENYKDPLMMNSMAWMVVEAHQKGAKVTDDVIELARKAIDLAVKEDRSAAVLDTFAHVLELQGDIDEAIKVQTEAVEKATDELKSKLADYLQSLKDQAE